MPLVIFRALHSHATLKCNSTIVPTQSCSDSDTSCQAVFCLRDLVLLRYMSVSTHVLPTFLALNGKETLLPCHTRAHLGGHRANRSFTFYCRARTPALVPIIVPVIGSTFIAAAAAWIWRAPLISRVLSRRLGARVCVKQFSMAPIANSCTLRNVTAHDLQGRPLLSLEQVRISFRKEGETRRRIPRIEFKRPEVVAIFFDPLCTKSNWSDWAKRFTRDAVELSSTHPRSDGRKKTRPADNRKHTFSDKQSSGWKKVRKHPNLHVDITEGLTFSLRSEVLGGNRIVNDVKFDNVNDIAEDLLSPQMFNRFVERLAVKTIKSARWFSIPTQGDVRSGARSFVRHVLRRETRGIRALGRVKIRRLRNNIGIMDEWLLRDNPDFTALSDMAKFSQKALYHVENILKMIDTENADQENIDAYSSTQEESNEAVASPDVIDSTRDTLMPSRQVLPSSKASPAMDDGVIAPPPALGPYLELDEKWEPRAVK